MTRKYTVAQIYFSYQHGMELSLLAASTVYNDSSFFNTLWIRFFYKGWGYSVTIGTLSINKSTDTYQYGHRAVPIHPEV